MPAFSRRLLLIAALCGAAAVMLGAFGAHALRARLDEYMLGVWQTAVQYHFWHALALGLVATLGAHIGDSRALRLAGAAMLAGILLFSGSLYAMALSEMRALGMVTPFGGVAFILGWIALALAVVRSEGRVR